MQKDQETAEQQMEKMDLAFEGQPFWSLLRVYVGFKLFDGKSTIENKQASRLKVISTWSLRQLILVFIRKKYLFIGNASDLLNLKGQVYHRLFYSTVELLGKNNCNVLLKGKNPYSTLNQDYGSTFLFELVSFILAQLLKPLVFLRYSSLQKRLFEHHVDLNVAQIISYHIAAYWLWKMHFCIAKPKKIFLSDWYNAFQMALIRAAKEAGIETIEFQHGMLSQGHYGYFYYSKRYDDKYNADRFFCFGPHFAKLLENKSVYRLEQAIIIGHPALDLYKEKLMIVRPEKQIVLVTLQDLVLEQTLQFIRKAARSLPNVELWLLPRGQIPQINEPNVRVLPPGKFYEWIQQAHVHSTVFSSTAYEALYFGCPNILLNIEDFAPRFMNDLMEGKTKTVVVNSVEEFGAALDKFSSIDRLSVQKSAESYFIRDHQLQLHNYFQTDRPI